MPVDIALTAFVTLFVVIDPVSTTPIFVALTMGMAPAERRRIAVRAVAIGLGLLVLFGIAGESLLDLVGIEMPAFRIAGGLLLYLTALEMLFGRRGERRGKSAEQPTPDPSVFPLAIPLIAGPGAFATIILLMGQHQGNLAAQAAVLGMMLGVMAITYALFMAAGPIERLLGPTGINVVTRLLGMLLAALAVQFVMDGLQDFGVFRG
jgi:multiple antibiotic resistance protein